MARVNVSVPDQLLEAVRSSRPGLNVSRLVQLALSGALECDHPDVVCTRCAAAVDVAVIVDGALGRFYADVLWELRPFVDKGATAEGAARVMKRVALEHQVTVAGRMPLPRAARAAREDAAWERVEGAAS